MNNKNKKHSESADFHPFLFEDCGTVKPGVKQSTPQIYENVPCSMLDLSWKYHENIFMRFPVMLLTDKQTDQQRKKRLPPV